MKQIKHLLKQRDELHSDSQWVLNEVLDGRRLQSGGTFQNVLSKRLDEVVIPVFASIIAFVDQYSNLAHLHSRYVIMMIIGIKIATIFVGTVFSLHFNSFGFQYFQMLISATSVTNE